jgi:hypothetical protein
MEPVVNRTNKTHLTIKISKLHITTIYLEFLKIRGWQLIKYFAVAGLLESNY